MPNESSHYLIEVYLPHPIQGSQLMQDLRLQWSANFKGTTAFVAEGTYLGDPPEPVTILRVYVPTRINRDDVLDYFTARRAELERRFPDQDAFLVTFSEGHNFL